MNLGISSRELPGGLHVCYLFGDDDERFELVARFFEAGVKAGDKLFLKSQSRPRLAGHAPVNS
jgi:hypothetical protein